MELVLSFGKHRGKEITDPSIPSSYKIWLYDEVNNLAPPIRKWIHDNLEELEDDVMAEECDATEWDLY